MKFSSRWLPVLIAPVVVVGAVAIPVIANADAPLPDRSAAEVLAMISGSGDIAYSGEVQLTSDLGLPDLSTLGRSMGGGGGDAVTSLVGMVTGTHSLRLYTDGSSGQRVQVLDSLAERDLVRDGDDVWAYDSAKSEAYHLSASGMSEGRIPSALPSTSPLDAARQLIDAVNPHTDVAVVTTDKVAGRSVYELRLVPRSRTTLVQSVTVAVDSTTGLPLKVSVDGDSGPAVTLEFTSIDFTTPAASLFAFTPPPGATVTEVGAPTKGERTGSPQKTSDHPEPAVVGTGWETIVVLPAGSVDPSALAGDQGGMLATLTTQVGSGRAFETSLLTVLVTGDGRVFAGAVPLSALEAAAG